MIRVLAFGIGLALAAYAGLNEIKNEPNLEKRAQLALENAQANFKEAQRTTPRERWRRPGVALADMQSSVELARDSLDATGKNPRKRPKYFKIR